MRGKDIAQMTRFDILRELQEMEEAEEERSQFLHGSAAAIRRSPVELIRRKALLKHQLKLLEMRTADGEDAKALEEHWKRQAEEEQKRQKVEEEAEKKRLELAKKQAKQEMQTDVDQLFQVIAGLTPEQQQKLLKKFQQS
jgi:thymidylate synthase